MHTPTVTPIQRSLEPVTTDPFVDRSLLQRPATGSDEVRRARSGGGLLRRQTVDRGRLPACDGT